MSTRETVDRFLDALGRLEGDEELDPLVELFADDVRVDTATATDALRGSDGARKLWQEDRELFASVRSEFRNQVVDGDVAILEWQRTAEDHDGQDVSHPGVTVIEVEGDRIARFAVYFDAARLHRRQG
jgi:ketosteroid isomerase-like protein